MKSKNLLGGLIIDFKKITLNEKEIFDNFLKKQPYENSHFNFTNLFMWRKLFDIRWTVEGTHLFIRSFYNDEMFMLPPIGPTEGMENALNKIYEYQLSLNVPFTLRETESFMVDFIEKWKPGEFEFIPETDNFDYVYDQEDLANLQGRKYHGKKNHLNKFLRTYPDFQYLPLDDSLVEKCLETIEHWCAQKNCDEDPFLKAEKIGIIEVLENFSHLNIRAAVVLINDNIEAFTFGEKLNDEMAVIHVEKANYEIEGIYAFINKTFSAEAFSDVKYINREEDLGIPGLKKAKESYHPIKMVKKYTVIEKKSFK